MSPFLKRAKAVTAALLGLFSLLVVLADSVTAHDNSFSARTGLMNRDANRAAPAQSSSTPDNYIHLEFLVGDEFPVRNGSPSLYIGDKVFTRGGGGGRHAAFALTPEEFASVSDGEEVWILGPYYFGPLDKRKLKMTEDLQGTKRVGLAILTQVRANITDPQRLAKLDELIDLFKDSFASIYWLDGAHLQPATGEAMFDNDIALATALEQMILDPTSTPAEQDTLDRARFLAANADWSVVSFAIEDAKAAGVPREITDKAVNTRIWPSRTKPGSYATSISTYRSAWLLVINGLSPTPTKSGG
jgi:hypothetical protein